MSKTQTYPSDLTDDQWALVRPLLPKPCQRGNINGRKRHLLVEVLGLLISCVVHAADILDEDGCEAVLDRARERFPRLKKIWADSRYACKRTPECVWIIYGWVLEVVRRLKGAVGFVVLPRRWVVERTFGWFVL